MSEKHTPRPDQGATPTIAPVPHCPTCKDVRWVKSDSEWPGPAEDLCPDCTDGICEGCDAPGNTCRECDEEWCSDCWNTDAHGEHCHGKGANVNDGPDRASTDATLDDALAIIADRRDVNYRTGDHDSGRRWEHALDVLQTAMGFDDPSDAPVCSYAGDKCNSSRCPVHGGES